MTVRTHSGHQLLEALAHHRDVAAGKLSQPEPLDRETRSVTYGFREAFTIALEIVEKALPGVESDAIELLDDAEPTGWDDGSFAEYNRGPSLDEMRTAGRA